MAIKQVVASLLAVTFAMAVGLAASPKGPQSGLLNRISVVEPAGDQYIESEQFGRIRSLPAIAAESVFLQDDSDGSRFTLLRFSSPGAAGIRLQFRNMHVRSDARVYVYGLDGSGTVIDVTGPFNGAGPMQSGDFWSAPIHGSDAIVEVQFDGEAPSDLPFEVSAIGALDSDLLGRTAFSTQSIDEQPGEFHRSLYKGVIVEHEIRDGLAVFEGDMILGPAEEMKPVPANLSKLHGKESTATTWTSSRWPNGVMPYTIDPALPNPVRVTDAVNYWNQMANGVVRLVPRTNEKAYVIFAYTTNASYCASSVGMTGNAQSTYIGDYCSTMNIVHEIGHGFGLWHEHTRNDRNTYVKVSTENITPSALSNFSQTGTSGMDIGVYDYDSIMHYPAYAFSANGSPTITTIPAGISIGQRSYLSTGDLAGITTLYGNGKTQTIAETINTNPNGGQIQVDGATVVAPYSGTWAVNSSHTVSAMNPTPANGQKLVFSNWSNGGAQTQTITASASTSSLVANYATSYQLQVQASPAGGGNVTITPASSDGYYPVNSTISLVANPAAGYCFSSWTGLIAGTPASTSISMTKAYSLVANFTTCTSSSTSSATFAAIRVNAGGGAYTDSTGKIWSADTGFLNGAAYSVGSAIPNTNAPGLYQSERWAPGTLQYSFAVPNGTYNVSLKFAEIYFTSCGQRVFNIAINGQTLTPNFDPCAAAGGSNRAVEKNYSVSVTGGQVAITLAAVIENPKISGIEITTGTPTNTITTSTPSTPPTSTFSPIRVNAGGLGFTDGAGNVWSGDTGYLNGNLYTTGNTISNTSTPAMYKSERWGAGGLQYAFTVPNGTYNVSLKFAEIFFTSCGQRVFNILINGQTLTSNFDPCAAAGGPNLAVEKNYSVSVTGGQLAINLVGVIENPKISGIEITASTSSSTTTTTTTSTTTPPPTTPPAFTPIRLNAGGPALTDPSGQVWAQDNGYTNGETYGNSLPVSGTTFSGLYQSERWGAGTLQYTFTVPNATYTVTLKFAEIFFNSCGQRIFNIVINGQTVATNFDPCAAAGGPNRAVDRQFPVSTTNGQITIQLVPVVQNPKISGIEIQ